LNTAKLRRLQALILAGLPPIRYGAHPAPAAAEVVASSGSWLSTCAPTPASARQTAVVSPITPAPITSTSPRPIRSATPSASRRRRIPARVGSQHAL